MQENLLKLMQLNDDNEVTMQTGNGLVLLIHERKLLRDFFRIVMIHILQCQLVSMRQQPFVIEFARQEPTTMNMFTSMRGPLIRWHRGRRVIEISQNRLGAGFKRIGACSRTLET